MTDADHSRERWLAFWRFVRRRFLDDRCFEAAGALSFTTVFALVPLSTAAFGILAAFPVFDEWSRRITDFIFANFVPAAGKVVQSYLTQFAANASKLTSAGVIALLVSALLVMASVEDTFNRIWRVPARRRRLARFVVYWTVLTLGPILIAASLGVSSYLVADSFGDGEPEAFGTRLLGLLPVAVTWSAVTLAYLVVPNGTVRLRHAALGGAVATVLFETAKLAFTSYLGRASYEQIYGALAVFPILLIWIYVSWTVVLLGASLAASLSAFRFQPAALRVPPGLEFAAFLRCLGQLRTGAAAGRPLTRDRLMAHEPGLTDEQLDRFLALMRDLRLVQRGDGGEWLTLRDAAALPLGDLFDAGGFRLPSESELERLAVERGPSGDALVDWLRRARAGLAPALRERAAAVLAPVDPEPTTPSGDAR